MLARAGCLRGRRATTYPPGKDELAAGGAVYTGKGVEVDGRYVTGSGPEDARAFGAALLEVLTAAA